MLAGIAAALLLAAAPRAPAFVAVVDPGHGGDQEGALSPAGDREKDVALALRRSRAAEHAGFLPC
jgi:N-acetylmuramoyl-L-alanine amidase